MLLFLKENKNYFYDMRFNISLENLSEEEAFDHYYNGDFSITGRTIEEFQGFKVTLIIDIPCGLSMIE